MQTALPIASGLTGVEKAKLWAAADKLRGHLDAAEYKHVVLGLIFLKYISDAFEEHYAALAAQRDEGVDPEDKDEYTAEGIFWVPPNARWSVLKANARQPANGTLIDGAMEALESGARNGPDHRSLDRPRPRDARGDHPRRAPRPLDRRGRLLRRARRQ